MARSVTRAVRSDPRTDRRFEPRDRDALRQRPVRPGGLDSHRDVPMPPGAVAGLDAPPGDGGGPATTPDAGFTETTG